MAGLIFAFSLRIVLPSFANISGGPARAATDQTPARDSGLFAGIHPAERLRAEPRGDWRAIQSLVAGHRAQAPHEPAGERVHPAVMEPEPVGRTSLGQDRAPRR